MSGVPTRGVDDLVAAMGVASGVSKSEVSRICEGLDARVDAFRNRTLGHVEFPYVFLDATYVHVRDDALGQVVSRAIVVATGVTGEGGREILGRVEVNCRFVGFVVEVGKPLELHDRLYRTVVGDPSPDPLGVRLEFRIAEGRLESGRVDCSAGHLQVDLDIDVGCAGMTPSASGAQHLGYQATEDHELGPRAVLVHDTARALSDAARAARERSVSATVDNLEEVLRRFFPAHARLA